MLKRGKPDAYTISAALQYHMLGWSQRDVAAAVGMSQRWFCYLLKRHGLKPNGYKTAASQVKRSRSSAETALRNRELRSAVMTEVATRNRDARSRAATEAAKWNREIRSRSAAAAAALRRARAPVETPWEAVWPVLFGAIPARAGYQVFAALSRRNLVEHGEDGMQILPRGDSLLVRADKGRLERMAAELDVTAPFSVGGRACFLDEPELRPAAVADELRSWCVTAKGKDDVESFEAWCRRELKRLGVNGLLEIGGRRVIRIKGKIIVGYQVTLSQLHYLESLRLQAVGLGGRRRFGCGVFV